MGELGWGAGFSQAGQLCSRKKWTGEEGMAWHAGDGTQPQAEGKGCSSWEVLGASTAAMHSDCPRMEARLHVSTGLLPLPHFNERDEQTGLTGVCFVGDVDAATSGDGVRRVVLNGASPGARALHRRRQHVLGCAGAICGPGRPARVPAKLRVPAETRMQPRGWVPYRPAGPRHSTCTLVHSTHTQCTATRLHRDDVWVLPCSCLGRSDGCHTRVHRLPHLRQHAAVDKHCSRPCDRHSLRNVKQHTHMCQTQRERRQQIIHHPPPPTAACQPHTCASCAPSKLY